MPLSKLRILYIEDHDDTRELVKLVLEELHYRVATANTIKSALMLASEQEFDLYLLDTWLPDGSGLELCRLIREFDPVTPILFYSAAVYDSDKARAHAAGAQGYLAKPCAISELQQMVSTHIKRPRAHPGPVESQRPLAVRVQ